MLVQFTFGNFISFREKATLSMVKSAMHDLPENVTKVSGDFGLLKSAVVYGANASGKSNLIIALKFMRFFAINSFRSYQKDEEIGSWSFRLNNTSITQPSFFEIVFIVNNNTYRYGFEVGNKKVNKEWLYRAQKNVEEKLFNREGLKFDILNVFPEGKGKETSTRENCLFLSVVSQFNGPISSEIINWFTKLRPSSSLSVEAVFSSIEENADLKDDIIKFVSIADNGVIDFTSKDITPAQPNDATPRTKRKSEIKKLMYFIHNVFNDKKEISGKVNMNINVESEGTKQMFALSMPIINALRYGEIIVIDELENSLHPKLFLHIIKLFNSYANKNNAQLIFATHNLTCMNNNYFRRDQIWFTDKNSLGESTLFSLADYKLNDKKIRKDASYSKDYLLGKYGAIPFIDEIDLSFRCKDNELSK